MHDVEILSLASGRPELFLHGEAAAKARAMTVQKTHVSISHERDMAGGRGHSRILTEKFLPDRHFSAEAAPSPAENFPERVGPSGRRLEEKQCSFPFPLRRK